MLYGRGRHYKPSVSVIKIKTKTKKEQKQVIKALFMQVAVFEQQKKKVLFSKFFQFDNAWSCLKTLAMFFVLRYSMFTY